VVPFRSTHTTRSRQHHFLRLRLFDVLMRCDAMRCRVVLLTRFPLFSSGISKFPMFASVGTSLKTYCPTFANC
jgi:hypothetical protein